jgi:hypothetical protein
VQLKARVLQQPALDRRRLVRAQVVEHEVNVELLGHLMVDAVEEAADSTARCRRCSWPITLPVATSSAANN